MEWTRISRWFLLATCFLPLGWPGYFSAEASPSINWPLLRDSICAWETRGSKNPDREVGKKHGELGRCQLRFSTLQGIGFLGGFAVLEIREVNEYWALQVLTRYCHVPSYDDKGRLVHHGYRTAEGLAWCYNGGKFRGKLNRQDAYVQGVMEIYKGKLLAAK